MASSSCGGISRRDKTDLLYRINRGYVLRKLHLEDYMMMGTMVRSFVLELKSHFTHCCAGLLHQSHGPDQRRCQLQHEPLPARARSCDSSQPCRCPKPHSWLEDCHPPRTIYDCLYVGSQTLHLGFLNASVVSLYLPPSQSNS
jgi:hypothetical protein